jgi:hypothetical protein
MKSTHRLMLGVLALAAVFPAGACNLAGGGEATVIYDASPGHSQITVAPTELRANGVETANITVQLRDRDETSLQQGGDFVDLSTNIGTLSPVIDENNGRYTATLRSNVPGLATITGAVNGGRITTSPQVRFNP